VSWRRRGHGGTYPSTAMPKVRWPVGGEGPAARCYLEWGGSRERCVTVGGSARAVGSAGRP